MADFVNDLEIAHQVYTIENVDVEDKTIKVYFQGDDNTPFKDGFYEVVITFDHDYPASAPMAFFTTPIWSPRVDPQTSKVIFDDGHYNVAEACEFVRSAMNQFVIGVCGESFEKTAQFWTTHYAGGNTEKNFEWNTALEYLTELGFPEKDSLIALSNSEFKVELAIEEMLNKQERQLQEHQGPIAHGEPGPSGLQEHDDEEDDEEEGEVAIHDSSDQPGSSNC